MVAFLLSSLLAIFPMKDHPFLSEKTPIAWHLMTPEAMERDVTLAIQLAQQRIDAIAHIDLNDTNFRSIILPLEEASRELDRAWLYASHLTSVTFSEEQRNTYNKLIQPVTEFYSKIALNHDLWERIQHVYQQRENENLTPIQERLLEETYLGFVESGAALDDTQKQEFAEIQKALAQKTQTYADHVVDATDAWEKYISNDEKSLLDGLPESVLIIMKADAEAHQHPNAYRLTLQMPVYAPAMRYLKNENLRKELWEAYSELGKCAPYDNSELIVEILQLRQREAQLLGYRDFSDFALDRRMAKNGQNASNFVENLHQHVRPFFLDEIAQLEAVKANSQNHPQEHLEPWEVAYWSEQQCQKIHHFDDELLRPYFEMNATLNGLFTLLERLYQVKFIEKETTPQPIDSQDIRIPVWHSDVRFFEVYENNGKLLGAFYLDLHPRNGKRSGAWQNTLREGYQSPEGYVTPIGLVAANLTPSTPEKPSLLTHSEVETIYHEFGHLMHALLGRQEFASLNGTNVAWDFVEFPSQIMENWTWEKEHLDQFARHYLTHETLPEELFQRMMAARNYQAAMATMRQLSFAKMDLELHRHYDFQLPLDQFIANVIADYTIPYRTPHISIIRHFGHLFSDSVGYAAAYYSYKWAEVLDADGFTRFQKEGIFNTKTANDFRQKVLEKGNSRPADELYRDFMGRDPDPEALMVRSGLVAH